MTYKEYNPHSFKLLDLIAMNVSKISDMHNKLSIGVKIGF